MNTLTVKFCALLVVIVLFIGGNGSAAQTAAPTPAATAAPQEVTFPALTGPYKVGRTAYEWVDQSRGETFASVQGLKRDLMINVWFPASVTKRTKMAPYMDSGVMWDDSALGQAAPVGIRLVGHPGLNDLIHTHAYRTSILDTSQPSYPVLIFVHGGDPDSLVEFNAFNYASILEDIASHGYIVIATSHPYSDDVVGYPDGRLVLGGTIGNARDVGNVALLKTWTQDVEFVIDQTEKLNATDDNFKGHLDLTRIGVFGAGFGGMTTIEVTATDPRVKTGLTLNAAEPDSYALPSVGNKPLLDAGLGANTAQQSHDKFGLSIDGMDNLDYGDFGFLTPLIPELSAQAGSIDPARGIQILNSYVVAFFDHYLKGAALTWPTYPEAHLITLGTAN